MPGLYPDMARSRACQAHCRYWTLNGFSGHDETPGRRGYSKSSAEAGRRGSVIGGGSPAHVLELHRTILHRVTPIGDAANGFGLGYGPGYCAWTDHPRTGGRSGPLLVPAPGQTNVPARCEPESPPPDRDPNYYGTTRGYPISVSLTSDMALANYRLALFTTGRRPQEVEGDIFSPSNPYSSKVRRNSMVFFVAIAPLKRGRYAARFEGDRRGGGTMTLVWTFTCTGR